MKQNKVNKITIVLMLITVLVVLVGILALARYTTTVSATGNAVVAAWKFDAKKDGATISSTSIDLADTITGTVDGTKLATKRIAPGTKGEFAIDVDASNSEVGVDYTVALNNFDITKGSSTTTMPANIKFSYREEGDSVKDLTLSGSPLAWSKSGNFVANASSKTKKITIYWEWPYQTITNTIVNGVDSGDIQDTTDEGKNITFNVVVTGNQVNPGLGV